MTREGALWIGGLEPYMDDLFLRQALHLSGEDSIVSIKLYNGKDSTIYGFINFDNDYSALLAFHKLNGKIMPNANPPARFKLSHHKGKLKPGEREHSIWVGDLTSEVDDLQMYKFFAARFQSIRFAKVVVDINGASKGFGFVHFSDEGEKETALSTMSNLVGLGGRPIRVRGGGTHGKHPSSHGASSSSYQQAYSYPSYPAQYSAAVQQYYEPTAYAVPAAPSVTETQPEPAKQPRTSKSNQPIRKTMETLLDGPSSELVPHSGKIDYDCLNKHFFITSEELWEAVDNSRWSSSCG